MITNYQPSPLSLSGYKPAGKWPLHHETDTREQRVCVGCVGLSSMQPTACVGMDVVFTSSSANSLHCPHNNNSITAQGQSPNWPFISAVDISVPALHQEEDE